MDCICSTTTLYHLLDSLRESPTGTALLNFGDLSYAGEPAALHAVKGTCYTPSHPTCMLDSSGLGTLPHARLMRTHINACHHA